MHTYIYKTTHLNIWQRMEGQRAIDNEEIAELLPGEAGASEGEGTGSGEGREVAREGGS
jgi:hypothetical protein